MARRYPDLMAPVHHIQSARRVGLPPSWPGTIPAHDGSRKFNAATAERICRTVVSRDVRELYGDAYDQAADAAVEDDVENVQRGLVHRRRPRSELPLCKQAKGRSKLGESTRALPCVAYRRAALTAPVVPCTLLP